MSISNFFNKILPGKKTGGEQVEDTEIDFDTPGGEVDNPFAEGGKYDVADEEEDFDPFFINDGGLVRTAPAQSFGGSVVANEDNLVREDEFAGVKSKPLTISTGMRIANLIVSVLTAIILISIACGLFVFYNQVYGLTDGGLSLPGATPTQTVAPQPQESVTQ